jgi:hypothetical protein
VDTGGQTGLGNKQPLQQAQSIDKDVALPADERLSRIVAGSDTHPLAEGIIQRASPAPTRRPA